MKTPPDAYEPLHDIARPNQEIRILTGRLSASLEGKTVEGTGALEFTWLPTPGVSFSVSLPTRDVPLDIDAVTLAFDDARAVKQCFSSSNLGAEIHFSEPTSRVYGRLDDGILLGERCGQIRRARFDVTNFHECLGRAVAHGSHYSRGRIELESPRWRATLDAVSDLGERHKRVRAGGGFITSHGGRLERSDGRSFEASDLRDATRLIRYWLSLARGLWCAPLFWNSGKGGWVQYEAPPLSPWKAVRSWFPLHDCERAFGTFSTLESRLSDGLWKEPFGLAIYWYVHANQCEGGVEGSTIMAQAALELLAWTYLVGEGEGSGLLSKSKYKSSPKHEVLERLLSELGIPIALPSGECPALGAWADSVGKASSGPRAVAGVRNAVVHADNKESSVALDGQVKLEAWTVSLLYLECTLLSLLAYSGPIDSRLRVGCPDEGKAEWPWLPG